MGRMHGKALRNGAGIGENAVGGRGNYGPFYAVFRQLEKPFFDPNGLFTPARSSIP